MKRLFFFFISAHIAYCQINPLDVEIVRDKFGVPHIFGKTDEDVAYGLAWANAEDDFENIAENMYLYRAQMGLKDGASGAVQDYLIKTLKIRPVIQGFCGGRQCIQIAYSAGQGTNFCFRLGYAIVDTRLFGRFFCVY